MKKIRNLREESVQRDSKLRLGVDSEEQSTTAREIRIRVSLVHVLTTWSARPAK